MCMFLLHMVPLASSYHNTNTISTQAAPSSQFWETPLGPSCHHSLQCSDLSHTRHAEAITGEWERLDTSSFTSSLFPPSLFPVHTLFFPSFLLLPLLWKCVLSKKKHTVTPTCLTLPFSLSLFPVQFPLLSLFSHSSLTFIFSPLLLSSPSLPLLSSSFPPSPGVYGDLNQHGTCLPTKRLWEADPLPEGCQLAQTRQVGYLPAHCLPATGTAFNDVMMM